MAEQLTDTGPIEDLVADWAEFTYERLVRQLERRKIKATGDLQRELKRQIITQGDVLIARFNYPVQGKFVDMGVGAGVRVATRTAYRQAAGKTGRQKKPWFNKPFFGRYYWLAEAVATNLAERIVEQTTATLTHTIRDGS